MIAHAESRTFGDGLPETVDRAVGRVLPPRRACREPAAGTAARIGDSPFLEVDGFEQLKGSRTL